MSQMSQALGRRPGLVTFAAIMMFILAGFELTFALVEFTNATWLAFNVYGSFGGHLWIWGILDAIVAMIAFYAGVDILRGGTFGQVIGIMIAAFSAIRWFFYLPSAPILALVVIGVDILIIYGLTSSADYFRTSAMSS